MKRGSVYDALIRGVERHTYPQESGPKRKNGKPEKQVEKDVIAWAEHNKLFLHVVEAKAVYSVSAGRYLAGQAEGGFPDLVGNNSDGNALWIELKAKGRRSNASVDQYEFLNKKIEEGCFAVVVDSVEILNEFYYTWLRSKNRQVYLKSILPVPSAIRKENQKFDPEMGF